MTPCSLRTKHVFSGQITLSTMFFILSNFLLVNRGHLDRNHLHFFVARLYDSSMERLIFYYRKVNNFPPSHTTCTGFQMAKKYPLLIQSSRPLRDSQEPKTKNISILLSPFLENHFLYCFLHKSWILGKKQSNFMDWFKSAILEKLKNCQEKVQKVDFLKKPLRELKICCCFRFL